MSFKEIWSTKWGKATVITLVIGVISDVIGLNDRIFGIKSIFGLIFSSVYDIINI